MTDLATRFTYIDAAVLIIIAVFALVNARKGLAGALLRFMPTLLGIFLSWKMSSGVIKFVRETALFSFISDKIEGGLNHENILPDMTMSAQNEIISGMDVPDFIKDALITNNNSVVYKIFDAGTLQDYIAGFLTNVLVSVAVVVLLYFIGLAAGRLILKLFNMANDIPVLGFFSRLGGFIVGLAKGLCVIWVIGIIITFFCFEPWAAGLMTAIEESTAAGWLYRNNILLYVVLRIIA